MTGQPNDGDDMQETQLFEVEEAKGDTALREEQPLEGALQHATPQKQNVFAEAHNTIEQLLEEDEQ